jgi:hypothetical protein
MGLPSGWSERDRPPEFVKMWREKYGPEGTPPPRFFEHRDGRYALLGREPYGPGPLRWHISLRVGDPGRNGRIPTWEECVNTAHELRPGVPFVLGIPPRSWWMNVHPHVLHLVETLDEPLIEEWKSNRQGHRPT